MLLSVVIPTCNRPELLGRCLSRLMPDKQTFKGAYEIIVSDDGDPTVEQFVRERFSSVRWVRGPRRGPAANRNRGSREAGGQWLVFTDDDCLPEEGWLAAYAAAIGEHATLSALEGAIHPDGDLSHDLAECPVNLVGDCFWSANVAIERSLFFAVGGFDENYRLAAHEDQDLFLRLKRMTSVAFVPNARVRHPVRYRSLRTSLMELNKRGLNWLYFASKNLDDLGYEGRWGIATAWYRSQLAALWQAARHGHPRQAIYAMAWLVYGGPFLGFHLGIKNTFGTGGASSAP